MREIAGVILSAHWPDQWDCVCVCVCFCLCARLLVFPFTAQGGGATGGKLCEARTHRGGFAWSLRDGARVYARAAQRGETMVHTPFLSCSHSSCQATPPRVAVSTNVRCHCQARTSHSRACARVGGMPAFCSFFLGVFLCRESARSSHTPCPPSSFLALGHIPYPSVPLFPLPFSFSLSPPPLPFP